MQNKNNSLFCISIVYIIGILIGYQFTIQKIYLITILFFTTFLLIIGFLLKSNLSLQTLFLFIIFFFLGFIKINSDKIEPINNLSSICNDNEIITAGIVTEKPNIKKNYISFPLLITKILEKEEYKQININVIAKIYLDSSQKQIKQIEYGDRIVSIGKFIEPLSSNNPGEFNYKEYLSLNDIEAFYKIKDIKLIIIQSKGNGSFLEQKIFQPIKNYISKTIDNKINKVEASFLKGLLIGDRTEIPEDIKENFINAGTIHILAVSGLNVVFVILIFSFLYSIFLPNKIVRMFLLIFSLLFYMILAGSSPSIVRATIMGITFIIGNNLERKISQLNLLGLSALIILLIDSRQIFDLGFQLSFLCVFSLIWAYPIINTSLPIKPKTKIIKLSIDSVVASITVLIFISPFIAQINGKISIISIIANLLVVPLANISLALGFLQVFLSPIFNFLADLIATINQSLLWLNLSITNFFGAFKYSYIEAYFFKPHWLLLYYIICFSFFFSLSKKRWSYILIIIFISINIFIWSSTLIPNKNNLKVYFLNVGQGDATLLKTPNGKNILIDSGPKNEYFDAGEKILFPFFKREGINKIDLCFISHFHDDHYGGLLYLINKGMIKEVLYNDTIGSSNYFTILDSTCNKNNVILKKIDFALKELDNIKIINLNSPLLISTKKDIIYTNNPYSSNVNLNKIINNSSMVLKIYYGNTSFLFTGDIESDKEQELKNKWGSFLNSDIIKVAHHGSKTSSSEFFLNIVTPKISIISVGSNNKFKFPSKVITDRLRQIGSIIFQTDKDKAIILESDGINIKRQKWN